jgi:DNA-binding transcriptional MerR regulator
MAVLVRTAGFNTPNERVPTEAEYNDLFAIVTKNDEAHISAVNRVNDKVDAIASGLNEAINKLTRADAALGVNLEEINQLLQGVDLAKIGAIDQLTREQGEKLAELYGRISELARGVNTANEKLAADGQKIAALDGRMADLAQGVKAANQKLAADIDGVGKNVDGVKRDLTERVDRVDASLVLIKEGVEKINAQLGSEQFKKLKDFDVEWVRREVEESVKDRADYRELWAKQKKEMQAIERIEAVRGDPVLKALIAQQGLEVHVARVDLRKLADSQLSVKEALEAYQASPTIGYARMITNLSYAYALMALHYKVAREHVMAVVSEKTTAEMFFEFGAAALKAAVAAGLSALTGGVLGVFVPVIMDLAKSVKGAVTGGSGSEEAGSEITRALEQHDREKENEERADSIGEKATDELGSLVFGANRDGSLKDPYDFFLEKEVELRKLAATIAGTTDDTAIGAKKVQLDREYTLDELKASDKWGHFFTVNPGARELDEIWERVSLLLAVNMRRACWRAYCRSQWNNATFSYTIGVISAEMAAEEQYSLEGPASEWHYKVWDSVKLAPRHWEKICSDFRGPEDDPQHPFTVRAGRANEAFRRLENNAWISTAAVQCCQIKRPKDGIYIDLEKRSHFGGSESEPLDVPHGWTDKMLVYEARGGDVQGLSQFLRTIQTSGGVQVAISEVRYGRASGSGWRSGFGLFRNWTKSTGKKGSLSSSNRSAEALPIVKGLNMTVMVGRKGGDGESARSGGQDAVVRVYRAKKEAHSDGKPCAEVDGKQLCWYCRHTPVESQADEEFKAKLRLAEVDVATSGSRFIKSDGWNFQNFPTSPHEDSSYANVPGLYCVRLDPRPELQTVEATGGDLQFHVSDEWWFRILDRPDPANAPNRPEIVWKSDRGLGATAIAGTYRKANTADPDTPVLIHVRVDGKVYGPSTPITPSGTTPQDWEITGIPALVGGQIVQAMATWEATKDSDAAQTEGKRMWVMGFHLSVNDNLISGSTVVKGLCDAVEGVRIQVAVNGIWKEGQVRLEGERSKDTGRIAWSYRLGWGRDSALRGTNTVQARALPPIDGTGTGNVAVQSNVVTVRSPVAPTINQPEPYAKEVTGTAMPVFGGKVEIRVDGIEIKQHADLAGAKSVGEELVEWKISLAELNVVGSVGGTSGTRKGELGPASRIDARVVSAEEGNSAWATTSVRMPRLPVPTLDPVTAGASSLSGTIKEFPHMGIEVQVKTGTADPVWCTGKADFGTASSDGTRTWTLANLHPLPPTGKPVLVAGQLVTVRLTVSGITDKSDPHSITVEGLPSPSIDKPVAGADQVSGTVTHASALTDAKVVISKSGKELGESNPLGDTRDPQGHFAWKVTGLGDSLVPDEELEAVLVRNEQKCAAPAKAQVAKLVPPVVLPMTVGDKIVSGTADGLVPKTTRIQVLKNGNALTPLRQITEQNGHLVWSFELPVGLERGEKFSAKALMMPAGKELYSDKLAESESSVEVEVGDLPKPVITPKPLPGAVRVTGTVGALPDNRCFMQLNIGTGDPWKDGPWLKPEAKTWEIETPAVTSGKAIKARLVRRRSNGVFHSPESDAVTVDKPLPPSIDPLMAGATSISGRVPYITGGKISVTVHTGTSAKELTNTANVERPGAQVGVEQRWGAWQLNDLTGLPDSKTSLVAGWKVSAIATANNTSSPEFEEAQRMLVEELKPPRINKMNVGDTRITGTFEGITAEGVQIELTTTFDPENRGGDPGKYVAPLFPVSNTEGPPYVWSFTELTWGYFSTTTIPGYALGLVRAHKVKVRAKRNDVYSGYFELQVGDDPPSP